MGYRVQETDLDSSVSDLHDMRLNLSSIGRRRRRDSWMRKSVCSPWHCAACCSVWSDWSRRFGTKPISWIGFSYQGLRSIVDFGFASTGASWWPEVFFYSYRLPRIRTSPLHRAAADVDEFSAYPTCLRLLSNDWNISERRDQSGQPLRAVASLTTTKLARNHASKWSIALEVSRYRARSWRPRTPLYSRRPNGSGSRRTAW